MNYQEVDVSYGAQDRHAARTSEGSGAGSEKAIRILPHLLHLLLSMHFLHFALRKTYSLCNFGYWVRLEDATQSPTVHIL